MLVDVDMRVTDHFGPPVRREWARVWRAWAACDLCPLWTSVRLRLASLLRCRRHRDCCEVIPQARLLTVVFLLGNSRMKFHRKLNKSTLAPAAWFQTLEGRRILQESAAR
jgi:hypothetical protein